MLFASFLTLALLGCREQRLAVFTFPFWLFHYFPHSKLPRVWAMLGAQRRLKYWWTILARRRALQPPALQGNVASFVRKLVFSSPFCALPIEEYCSIFAVKIHADAIKGHRAGRYSSSPFSALRGDTMHLSCRVIKHLCRHNVAAAVVINTCIAHSATRLLRFQG